MSLFEELDKYARKEIELFGKPAPLHYEISLAAGEKLAMALGADVETVKCGIALMDIKLGWAAKNSRGGSMCTFPVYMLRNF